MIVHFVEIEKCLEKIDYTQRDEDKKFAEELKECYNFIKVTLPALGNAFSKSYPSDDAVESIKTHDDFERVYAENHRLEKQIEDDITRWLVWIVSNRARLWA